MKINKNIYDSLAVAYKDTVKGKPYKIYIMNNDLFNKEGYKIMIEDYNKISYSKGYFIFALLKGGKMFRNVIKQHVIIDAIYKKRNIQYGNAFKIKCNDLFYREV
jgi:hypothetical protein